MALKKKTSKQEEEDGVLSMFAKVSKLLVDQAYERGRAEAFAQAVQVASKGGYKSPEDIVAALQQTAQAKPGIDPTTGKTVPMPDAGLPQSSQTGMNIFNPSQ